MIDPKLIEYAMTARQREVINTVVTTGTQRATARILKVAPQTIANTVNAVKRRAALKGYSPEHDLTHGIAPGQELRGTSTLYGADGEQKLQWVKTRADDQARLEMLEHAVNVLAEDIKGLAKPIKAPKANRFHHGA